MVRRRSSLLQSMRSSILSIKSDVKDFDYDDDDDDENDRTPRFLLSSLGPKVAAILEKHADKIHDDSFLKIIRQLEFWHTEQSLSDDDFFDLAERLATIAGWREDADDATIPPEQKFKVPKVRFGKTELLMPIITCGGMRVQETWIPDTTPLLRSNKSKVVKSKSQQNLRDVILSCLKIGLNHFETARFYGTSEVQFVHALTDLMTEGIIQRDDFIFQTKIMVSADGGREAFAKQWKDSWSNVEKLGFVDLLSFHCVCDDCQIDTIISDAEDGVYNFVLDLKKEGKVKHVGFSTHGTAQNIMRLINSNKMEYVNLHHHYFGDYHAVGTSDTLGGQGNAACVKRALELDMGVFNISPFDKGGKLYRPSAKVAAAVGPELNPMSFAALYTWRHEGMHTLSVGLARSSDLDEVIEAAKIYMDDKRADALVHAAKARLDSLAIEQLGKEWYEKGLLNIPSFYEPSSDGVALGHMLWLHNCLTAYGMHEFARDRYAMLEKISWNKSKSFEENIKKNFVFGNPGRSYDEKINIREALKDHYDPELAMTKLVEVHNWLKKDTSLSEEEKKSFGWNRAYNLTTWEEYPGEVLSISNILLSRIGLKSGGGNNKSAVEEASVLRTAVRRSSSTLSLLSVENK